MCSKSSRKSQKLSPLPPQKQHTHKKKQQTNKQTKKIQSGKKIIQLHSSSGNNWGTCKNGTSGIGCGPQEEFYNCADIAILDNGTPGTMMLPGSAIARKNKPNVPVTLRPKNAFAPNGAVLSNALRNELQSLDGMKSRSSGPVNGISPQPPNGGFTPLGMPGQIKPRTNIFGKQGLLDGTIDPRNLISPLLTPVFGMGYQRQAMAPSPYGLNMIPGMVRETRSPNSGMNAAGNVATSLLMTMLPENNTSSLMNDPMFARNNALDNLFRELVFKHPNKNVPGYFNLRLIDPFKDIVITHILDLLRQANESYFVLGQNGSSMFPPDFGKFRPSLESPDNLLTSLVNNYVGNLLSASSSGSLGTGFGLNKGDLQFLLMLNAILAGNRPSNAYVSSINGNFPNIFRSRRFGPTWRRNTRGTQRSIINPEMILLSTLLGRKSHSGGGEAGEDRHSGSSLFGKTLAMSPKLQKILTSLLTDSRSRTAESAPFKVNLPNIFGSQRIEPMLRGPVVGTRQSTINPEMVLLSTLLGRKSRSGGGEASESSEGRSSSSFLGKTLATNPKLPILTPRLGPMMRENVVGTQQPKINPEMMLFSTLLGRKARSGSREDGGRGGGEASESQVSSAIGNLAGTSQLPMLAYMLGSNSGSGLGAKQLRGGNMAGMFGEPVRVPMSPMTAQFLNSSPSYFGRTVPSSLPYPLLPAMLTGGQRRASNVAASLGLPDFSAFPAMSAGEMGFGRNSPLSNSGRRSAL